MAQNFTSFTILNLKTNRLSFWKCDFDTWTHNQPPCEIICDSAENIRFGIIDISQSLFFESCWDKLLVAFLGQINISFQIYINEHTENGNVYAFSWEYYHDFIKCQEIGLKWWCKARNYYLQAEQKLEIIQILFSSK